MKHAANDRQELINLCKKPYVGNHIELELLKESEETYSPEEAVRWYTRDSFIYKMLNKALRVQDMDTLIAFQSIRRVYRGQLMSKDELDGMKLIIGKYLSLNSFLSTTLIPNVAFEFILNVALATNDLCRVLFEIDIDPALINVKPYADISLHSFFKREAEILFMLGSIFKIKDINTRSDGISVIKLELASINNNSELQQLSDYMKQNLAEEPNLTSLGLALKEMGQYENAKKCYERQANEIDHKNPLEVAAYYTNLGNVAYAEGNYDLAIVYHEKVLKLFQLSINCDKYKAMSYNNLAIAYHDKCDYEKALFYHNQALNIYKEMYGNDDHLNLANVYFNVGLTCNAQEKYEDAITNFELALEIQTKLLPLYHFDIANTLANLATPYAHTGDSKTAFEFLQTADRIYCHALPSTHPDVIFNKEKIQKIKHN
ncbi:unnamed protein product [Didymodactylos carnosus]|uniref:Tetratricopeptide repeat protein n=1 Tax=Didymodactylos carnosus TaxID=1234261 RepID=A0A8S2PKT5_9BILA|nr:unnamed protein product [Didymodactylos carnosus]CAF4056344.1 unnamed protein product [Didymodactylos carnosus]